MPIRMPRIKTFSAIAYPKKYEYDPLPDEIWLRPDGRKITLRRVKDEMNVFMLAGLTKTETRNDKYLHTLLRRYAPYDTGLLSRSYDVYPLEYKKTRWALVIYNRVSYFMFPFYYYLDRGRNFVLQAVEPVVRRILKEE